MLMINRGGLVHRICHSHPTTAEWRDMYNSVNQNVLIQPGNLPNGKNKKMTSAHPTTRHHL